MISIVGFNLSAADKNGEDVTFRIEENQNGNEIIENLEKENIIKSAFWFKVYMKLKGDLCFKTGSYILSPNDNSPEIYRQFK